MFQHTTHFNCLAIVSTIGLICIKCFKYVFMYIKRILKKTPNVLCTSNNGAFISTHCTVCINVKNIIIKNQDEKKSVQMVSF